MNTFKRALNPPPEYRPIPFWSWNDKLEAGELSRQIRLMHEAGIGGFFMHARGGLLTEYMSEDWFNLTKSCIHDAGQLNMNAWAYDENGWPSGFGSGAVNGLGVRYQQKYLRCIETPGNRLESIDHFIAAYTPDGRLLEKEAAANTDRILVCYYDVNPYYVDTLDAEVTRKFIEIVYADYHQKLSETERRGLKGFFTDEPQISRNGIPWSFIYEREYREAYGDDLPPLLPHLFFDMDGCRRTRYRFWRLTTRLFMNNFMKEIHDWCQSHGWGLTGHMVLEESYLKQLTCNGAVMPHYQYFSIPGMDALGRYFPSLLTPVQLASVAAQTGKKHVLSETFALCGWGVTFADLKWLCQWQMVHGVNLICQHLEGYSLRGLRKRDYPASLFIHQPWWPEYVRFNDYISRLGVLLAESTVHADVLIIHGITTAHLLYNKTYADAPTQFNLGAIDRYSQAFERLSQTLAASHISHHYGDETLMEQHGAVEGARLRIGQHSYPVVVLPKLMNLSARQAQLLAEFAANGGILLAERNDFDTTFHIDGAPANALPLLAQIRYFDSAEAIAAELRKHAAAIDVFRAGTTEQAAEINAVRRSLADFDGHPTEVNYFVNTERFRPCETEIVIRAAGAERYNPETGLCEPIHHTRRNGFCHIPFRFAPAADLVLLARAGETASAPLPRAAEHRIQADTIFQVADFGENLLTLDHCSCKADGQELFDHGYVLSIQEALLKLEREADVELGFTFEAASDYRFGQPLDLLLEHPERYEIRLNGQEISNRPHGFFADKAFERIGISGAVTAGRNSLTLKTRFHQSPETYRGIRASRIFEGERNKLSFHSEIEAVYLCGRFGVQTPGTFSSLENNGIRYHGSFALSAPPRQVDIRHLEQSGFPFFGGRIRLAQVFEASAPDRVHEIVFENLYANSAEVKINGRAIALLLYPDYRLRIPEGVLQQGSNTLEITLVNSLRNMLGPFHLEAGEPMAVGPNSFQKEPDAIFRPIPSQIWNPDYCFLRFGLTQPNA